MTEQTGTDVREQVRQRYTAAALAVTTIGRSVTKLVTSGTA